MYIEPANKASIAVPVVTWNLKKKHLKSQNKYHICLILCIKQELYSIACGGEIMI